MRCLWLYGNSQSLAPYRYSLIPIETSRVGKEFGTLFRSTSEFMGS